MSLLAVLPAPGQAHGAHGRMPRSWRRFPASFWRGLLRCAVPAMSEVSVLAEVIEQRHRARTPERALRVRQKISANPTTRNTPTNPATPSQPKRLYAKPPNPPASALPM